ncbi:MAG: hypothetical protein Q4C91_09680 [Eubacteriales bacterium]|nr:hypothetical protein [Eubacteriales bacterium]
MAPHGQEAPVHFRNLEELIQGSMCREFGFEGFGMTDWNSYDTMDITKVVQSSQRAVSVLLQ